MGSTQDKLQGSTCHPLQQGSKTKRNKLYQASVTDNTTGDQFIFGFGLSFEFFRAKRKK